MSIFDRDRIGKNVRCLLEKDGDLRRDYVKWTHARVGEIVSSTYHGSTESIVSSGWKVIEVDIPFEH